LGICDERVREVDVNVREVKSRKFSEFNNMLHVIFSLRELNIIARKKITLFASQRKNGP
jgi:hypothetical protein